MRAYGFVVSFRALLSLALAITLLFAPAFTGVAAAAGAPADHHQQMLTTGHCEPSSDSDMDEGDSKTCCIAMCMAIAVAPAAASKPLPLRGTLKNFLRESFRIGLPAEIATPPPRLA